MTNLEDALRTKILRRDAVEIQIEEAKRAGRGTARLEREHELIRMDILALQQSTRTRAPGFRVHGHDAR